MKIIHIGPDSQFTQFTSRVFEDAAPGNNEHIIFSESEELKYAPVGGKVSVLKLHPGALFELPNLLQNADAVIAHGLTLRAMTAFLIAPNSTVKIWSGWGFDYYALGNSLGIDLLGHRTSAIQRQLTNGSTSFFSRLKERITSTIRVAAIRRTHLFSAPIPNDFEIMRAAFPIFSGEYAQINYGDVKGTFSAGSSAESGRNILLGNSASPTNNHVEALEILSSKNLDGRKVIVPLSYGSTDYRNSVVSHGTKILGDAFLPITEFLPLQKYIDIVGSCGIVVMNHQRQQALGNIGSAIYHGARVYLDEHNPLYDFFKAKGAILETMHSLKSNPLPERALDTKSIQQNRSVLIDHWGDERVHSNAVQLIQKITSTREILRQQQCRP